MQVAITHEIFRAIKLAVPEQITLAKFAKSQTLTEVLARGLGSKTYAGLLSSMVDDGIHYATINNDAFLRHLAAHGVRMDLEHELVNGWPLEMVVQSVVPDANIIEANVIDDEAAGSMTLDELSRIVLGDGPRFMMVWGRAVTRDGVPILVPNTFNRQGRFPEAGMVSTLLDPKQRAAWVTEACGKILDRRPGLPRLRVGGPGVAERPMTEVVAEMIESRIHVRLGDGAEIVQNKPRLVAASAFTTSLGLHFDLPQRRYNGMDRCLERATRVLLAAAALAVACLVTGGSSYQGVFSTASEERRIINDIGTRRAVLHTTNEGGKLVERSHQIDVPEAFGLLNEALERWNQVCAELEMDGEQSASSPGL